MQHQAKSSPSVSVVVPTLSRPELLRKTLNSIYEQDFSGSIEAVVVYDGTEPDAELLSALPMSGQKGPRGLRILTNQRTPGLPGTRNTGVAASTGTLLAFCDDDDSWHPEKLSAQVDMMTETHSDLVVCGIEITIGPRTHIRVPSQEDVTVAELARRRVMEAHPSTVLVSREAFNRIGWVDEAIPGGYAEDYDWMLRALASEKVAVVSRPLVRVLWHPGSFFTTRWLTMIEALDYMIEKHPELRRSRRGLARLYGQKAVAYGGLKQRRESVRWAIRALGLTVTERRGYVALAIASGVVSADQVMKWANERGRGI